jgi:hypothetical protein
MERRAPLTPWVRFGSRSKDWERSFVLLLTELVNWHSAPRADVRIAGCQAEGTSSACEGRQNVQIVRHQKRSKQKGRKSVAGQPLT